MNSAMTYILRIDPVWLLACWQLPRPTNFIRFQKFFLSNCEKIFLREVRTRNKFSLKNVFQEILGNFDFFISFLFPIKFYDLGGYSYHLQI